MQADPLADGLLRDRLLAKTGHILKYNYRGSETVKQDVGAALEYLRDAAEGGHVEAQYVLGAAYANGTGTRASEFNGKRFLKLAAKQGHEGAIEELKRHFWN